MEISTTSIDSKKGKKAKRLSQGQSADQLSTPKTPTSNMDPPTSTPAKPGMMNVSVDSEGSNTKRKRKRHSQNQSTENLSTTVDPSTPKKTPQSSTPVEQESMEVSVDSVKSKKKKKAKRHSLSQSTEYLSTSTTTSPATQDKKQQKSILNGTQLDNDEKDDVPSQVIESSQFDASDHYILLGKIQGITSESDMQTFLNKNNIEVDELRWVCRLPMGIISFNSESQLNEVKTKLESLSHTTNVGWAELDGNVQPFLIKKQQLQSETTVFVSHLPPNISKSDLEEHLPSTIASGSWSSAFFHSNRKSTHFFGVKMIFSTVADAKGAITALNNCKISGCKVKASMFIKKDKREELNTPKKPSNPQTSNDSQVQHTTLYVRNLPSTADHRFMKELLPTGVKFDLKRRGPTNRCFVVFPDPQACREALDSIQGTVFDGLEITAASVPTKIHSVKKEYDLNELGTVLKVTNIPFDYKESQVTEEFPTASKVNLSMKGPNKNCGSMFLSFNSTEDCRAVFEACRQKKINGRKLRCFPVEEFPEPSSKVEKQKFERKPVETVLHVLRVSNAPFSLTEKDMKQYFPDAVKIELQKGETGSSKGIFLVSFTNLPVCQASQKSIVGLKVDGRAFRSEIIRNEMKEENSEKPATSQSEPTPKKARIEDSSQKNNVKVTAKKPVKSNKSSKDAEESSE